MIDPVKESYIRFQGSTFHMASEDSAAYERYMTGLDKRNKIIIIETMSGRNSKEDEVCVQ